MVRKAFGRNLTNKMYLPNLADLKEILWRRSSSSQTWLLRRTCFARSIATTSMIGYVIGLGDRHPGNILIEQTKFNAISIDFGDVFEAAAERTAFPEHVPFRLTPEIYNAFEASRMSGRPGLKITNPLNHTTVRRSTWSQSSRIPRSL
jgi:phosphatidylinositol kinase/protein kinase (PI-3  family)